MAPAPLSDIETRVQVQAVCDSGFTLQPAVQRPLDGLCVSIITDGAAPRATKRVCRQQEPDRTRVSGKHSYELNSSFPYEPGHHVSFKVVDVDIADVHGNRCIQLMCCGERRCRQRLGQGVGKGLLVPLAQLRNKKQNFLDPHVLHHLPERQGSAERETMHIERMSARTRELERAWLWHGNLPALQVVQTATAVEAWANVHLRSLEVENALCGTAIVIGEDAKILPPVLSWSAGSSQDLSADRHEYAATDGLLAFLEQHAGGGLKLHTPVAAQKPTVASLRTGLRDTIHPAVEMQLPLITELPAASTQDTQSKKLRAALLSLLGGEETMLPRSWLRDEKTVLSMLHDPSQRAALFLLIMHSHCNLEVHIDALGTGHSFCQPPPPPPNSVRPNHLHRGGERARMVFLTALPAFTPHSRHVPCAPRIKAGASLASNNGKPRATGHIAVHWSRIAATRRTQAVHWWGNSHPTPRGAADHRATRYPPCRQPHACTVSGHQLQLPDCDCATLTLEWPRDAQFARQAMVQEATLTDDWHRPRAEVTSTYWVSFATLSAAPVSVNTEVKIMRLHGLGHES